MASKLDKLMDNHTGFHYAIDNISNIPIPDIGVAAHIHLMEASSLTMQLAKVFLPMGSGMAHPASFTNHAHGVTSLKVRDTPTLALKAVKVSDCTWDNRVSVFLIHLKGRMAAIGLQLIVTVT